ncbi:MAG: Hpt domain-containing protein [Leptonema sp. (in: bacteria)]
MNQTYKVEVSIELKELIPIFLEETKKNINLLNESIEKNDLEKIRFYSHRIKGSAASYGINRLSILAKNLEDIIKTNQNMNLINTLFLDLKNTFENLHIVYVNKSL